MIFYSLFHVFQSEGSDHPVAIRNGVAIPFSQFKADVASFVHHYPRCHAALLCEDSYYFLVGLFGLLYSGSEITVTSKNQTSIAHLLQKECDVFIDDSTIQNLSAADSPLLPLDPTRLCIHFFTSGSTGMPKRISKNLTMLENEVKTLDRFLMQTPGTIFSTVPHHHVYGFIFKLLWPLASRHPFDSCIYGLWESLLSQLTPHALIISSPAHLRRLSGINPIEKKYIPEQIVSAGSPLNHDNIREIKTILGKIPVEVFGSTETGCIATRDLTTQGQPLRPLPNISISKELDGRLTILSPHVGEKWYITDDLIELAGEGFTFLGRADSVIKVEGRRVSLLEVEHALCHLDYVTEAAILLLPGSTDRLAAAVVLNADGQSQLAALGSFRFSRVVQQDLKHSLEYIAIPRVWRFVDSIITKGIGKRSMSDIQKLFEE